MAEPIRVLLADDHPAIRVGLRVLLEQASDIQVIAETGDGKEALTRIESLRPDVVVLDCELPGMQGAQVAMEINKRSLPTRVLALSAYVDEKYVRGMIDAGAVGYLLKDEAPERIVDAVRAAARGEGWFSPKVARQVAALARGEKTTIRSVGLTDQERELLQLVAQGKTNREIGRTLSLGEKAIEKHLTEIFAKLGVPSRAAAAAWAVREGLA